MNCSFATSKQLHYLAPTIPEPASDAVMAAVAERRRLGPLAAAEIDGAGFGGSVTHGTTAGAGMGRVAEGLAIGAATRAP